MNPRFLRYYSQELAHLREMGAEFARDYPKVAARLALDSFECADPYVERLLEGFSYLAARVQLKIDAEFPRFTQHLSELVYPHFLAPTPSMAVVQVQPDLANPALQAGVAVPRGSSMRSVLGKGDNTACEYRTGHALTLWPVELVEAKFAAYGGEPGGGPQTLQVKGALRLRLHSAGVPFKDLALDRLPLHLRGADELPARLYETVLRGVEGVLVGPAGRPDAAIRLPRHALRPLGFDDDEALLPDSGRSFRGYRLLQEYFAFAPRFHFVELSGLRPALARCAEHDVDVTILLSEADARLEQVVDRTHVALFCTPAINLFKRRADRINITDEQFEYHVLVDRTRPMDYEVFQVEAVTGYGIGATAEREFRPFYMARDGDGQDGGAFYQIRRERRLVSQRQRRDGPRSSYLGSEAFLSIVDAAEAPYRSTLRQLGLTVSCTNRDLPLALPLGTGKTDFVLDAATPATAVRCVAGPSRPYPSYAEGPMAWRLINHLSLNYLSLVDTDAQQGAAALRELLALYSPAGEAPAHRQVDGVRSIVARPVTRRMPSPGPIVFGRGLGLTLTLDDAAFEGTGAFLLGAVLDRFFAQYAPINTFTETAVRTVARGEIMCWPPRGGLCAIL